MQNKIEKFLDIETESGENEFQVRLLKDEGVGLLATRTKKSYFILDSSDYWYDLIQGGYPKKEKCSCKNEWFKIRFEYLKRPHYDDIKQVTIFSTCTHCGKKTESLSIDIDYSPTNHLSEQPITYCENPNIKYKFTEISSFWSKDDTIDFLSYMFSIPNMNVYSWFWRSSENFRYFEKITYDKALQIISTNYKHLGFFFSLDQIDTDKAIESKDDKGVYLRENIWRRDEIIHLSAPTKILSYGLQYSIHYCNQFLNQNEVTNKSIQFENLTNDLKNWLEQKFVTTRGKNCYDGEDAYKKLMKAKDGPKRRSTLTIFTKELHYLMKRIRSKFTLK